MDISHPIESIPPVGISHPIESISPILLYASHPIETIPPISFYDSHPVEMVPPSSLEYTVVTTPIYERLPKSFLLNYLQSPDPWSAILAQFYFLMYNPTTLSPPDYPSYSSPWESSWRSGEWFEAYAPTSGILNLTQEMYSFDLPSSIPFYPINYQSWFFNNLGSIEPVTFYETDPEVWKRGTRVVYISGQGPTIMGPGYGGYSASSGYGSF